MAKARRRRRSQEQAPSPGPSLQLPFWWPYPVVVAAALAVLGLVWPAMEVPFTQDDFTFLRDAVAPTAASEFGLFARPLARQFWFSLHWTLWGDAPLPFHLANYALHGISMVLLYAGVRRLTGAAIPALVAVLCFACHGSYLTLFAWFSCCQELLMTTFLLAAWLLTLVWRDRGGWPWLAGSMVCFALSLLSKEAALLFPLVLAVQWLLLPGEDPPARRRLAIAIAPATVIAGAFAGALLLGGGDDEATQYATAIAVVPKNLTIYVFWTRIFWTVIGRGEGPLAAFAPLELLLPAAILLGGWLTGRLRIVGFGLSWFVLFLAPVLPLELQVYRYYLYLPLAGWWLAVSAVLWGAAERLPRVQVPAWVGHAAAVTLAVIHLGISATAIGAKIEDQATTPDIGLIRRGHIARNFQRSASGAFRQLNGTVTLSLVSPQRTQAYLDRQFAAALAYGAAVEFFFPKPDWTINFYAYHDPEDPWPPPATTAIHLEALYLPNGRLRELAPLAVSPPEPDSWEGSLGEE